MLRLSPLFGKYLGAEHYCFNIFVFTGRSRNLRCLISNPQLENDKKLSVIMYRTLLLCCFLSAVLSGCGGGGGGGGVGGSRAAITPTTPPPAPPSPVATSDFDQGIFANAEIFEGLCLNPRLGTSGDIQGSAADENYWLRSWSNNLYLWYDEIGDRDPELSDTTAYFELMKTFATTPSGTAKDQFHFTLDTEAWLQLSQAGIAVSYGADFTLISATPPREVVVAFVEPGSPAANAPLARGAVVLAVDGVDLINGSSDADIATLNAGLFPSAAGEVHQFVVEDVGGVNNRTITLVAAEVTQDPVPAASIINTATGPVGYMLFNSHIATAEQRLVTEMAAFETAGITELVLDLRYNGGGFLDIANELAFMIAGPVAASGRVFDETQFNDKHPTTNPVTGQALATDTFHTVAQGFSVATGTALPSVNLPRVFVLAGPGTCSASEAIVNGLRGIDVGVILIGDRTCGKPYGFFPQDNCGTTYFSIQFRGVNAKGFGDYADGFVPVSTPTQEFQLQGCSVDDDFTHELGNIDEARFDAALNYISSGGSCPPQPIAVTSAASSKTLSIGGPGPGLTKPQPMPGTVRRR